MPRSRLAAPALSAALALSCGGGEKETSPAPSPPASQPARLLALPLSPGLVLALDPNLPGVEDEDVPGSARREVEVLELGKGGLRLRWSGRVRTEKPDSARRREEWVRARANAPPGATPVAAPPAAYESREVGGTLLFPDFATATEFLLPGLWPRASRRSPARPRSGSRRTPSPSSRPRAGRPCRSRSRRASSGTPPRLS